MGLGRSPLPPPRSTQNRSGRSEGRTPSPSTVPTAGVETEPPGKVAKGRRVVVSPTLHSPGILRKHGPLPGVVHPDHRDPDVGSPTLRTEGSLLVGEHRRREGTVRGRWGQDRSLPHVTPPDDSDTKNLTRPGPEPVPSVTGGTCRTPGKDVGEIPGPGVYSSLNVRTDPVSTQTSSTIVSPTEGPLDGTQDLSSHRCLRGGFAPNSVGPGSCPPSTTDSGTEPT